MPFESRVRVRRTDGLALQGWWGLLLLALATTVMAGIVAMHGLSVGHHIPVEMADQHVHAEGGHAGHGDQGMSGHLDRGNPKASGHVTDDPCPPLACGGGGAMAAMCVFMLLGLAFLDLRRGGGSWRWRPPWLVSSSRPPPPTPGHLARVSLTRLCNCRT